MKILLVLFAVLAFSGCENSVNTESNKDNVLQVLTVELSTKTDGIEIIECDRILYTNFQQQGLILYRDGEIIKWVTPENLKYYQTR